MSTAYTGVHYFLVLDTTALPGTAGSKPPLSGPGNATESYDVLGEAGYAVSYQTSVDATQRAYNTPVEDIDTHYIDGVQVVGMRDIIDYPPSGHDFSFDMGDGSVVNGSSGGAAITYMNMYELEDGRILLAIGGEDANIFDEINANGTGITSVNLNNALVRDLGSGTYSPYNSGATGTAPYTGDAPCFTTGTLIDTDQGLVAVETLQAGDMIRTEDHGFQPVRWVGESRVHDAPVRIKAGVFGNARDLVVSPRHRMLLQGWQMGLLFNHDEAFAAAKDMQNASTITMEPEGWVTYYHILLDRHEVIYAEGAETESFFPDEASLNSMAKATREELAQTVDLSTFGRTVRPTLTANQAMYLSHNMDLLEDEPQAHAAE